MSFALGLLAMLMIFVGGAGFLALLWRGKSPILLPEFLALGWLLGAGLVSLSLAVGGLLLPGGVLFIAVSAGCILLGAGGWKRYRADFRITSGLEGVKTSEKWLTLLVLLPILYIGFACFRDSLLWDGLVVWELKARHAFLAGGHLPLSYFSDSDRARFHPSYPLYLPFTELWVYLWVGDCDQTVVKLLFPVFYAAGVFMLWSLMMRLTGKAWAAVATSILPIFIPYMADHGLGLMEGYADFPLAIVYLAGVGALLIWRMKEVEGAWPVAVACAAFLPWIKQDGMFLLASLIALAAIIHGRNNLRRTILFALPGIFVLLGWRLAMRSVHAVDESVFQAATTETLMRNLVRLGPIAQNMGHQLSLLKNWSLLWFAVPIALAWLVWRQRQLAIWLMVALGLPLALDFLPYLFTNLDLHFHVTSSFDRLALQVSLVAVLCFGLMWKEDGEKRISHESETPAKEPEINNVSTRPRPSPAFLVTLVALLAMAAKLYCAARTIGTNDAAYFLKFALDIDQFGVLEMYGITPLFNHTPMVGDLIVTVLHIAQATHSSFFFWLRLPGITADFASVLALLWLRARTGQPPWWALTLFAASPVSFMVSGYHGNVDSILVLFVLLSACACVAKNAPLCGLWLGLACQVKIVPLLLVPIFLFHWLHRRQMWRFAVPFAVTIVLGWGTALLQVPGPFVRNVLSYGGYWGEWGITCALHATGISAFQPLGFTGLNPTENAIMFGLKVLIVCGIAWIAWSRRAGEPATIFASLSLAWAIFFVLAPGAGPQHMVWFAPFLLVHSPRWYAIVTAVCTVFLGVYYTMISHGLPWNFGNSTLQLAPLLRPWTALPWIALTLFLAVSIWEILRRKPEQV